MPTPSFPEDARPLAGFYPDKVLRIRLRRYFTRDYLPREARRSPFDFLCQASLNPTAFIQARWQMMEREMNLPGVPPAEDGPPRVRHIADLQAWTQEVAGHLALFIELPPAAQPTDDALLAVVLLAPGQDAKALVEAVHRHQLGHGPEPHPGMLARFRQAEAHIRSEPWTLGHPGLRPEAHGRLDRAWFVERVAGDFRIPPPLHTAMLNMDFLPCPLTDCYPVPHVRGFVHCGFSMSFLPQVMSRSPAEFFAPFFAPGAGIGALKATTESILARWRTFEILGPKVSLPLPLEAYRREDQVPFPLAVALAMDPLAAVNRINRLDYLVPRRRPISHSVLFPSDLRAECVEVGGLPAVLIELPPPTAVPQAWFALAVLLVPGLQPSAWSRSALARYFTLERFWGENGVSTTSGFLCEIRAGLEHRNYGDIPVNRDDFLRAVTELLGQPDAS